MYEKEKLFMRNVTTNKLKYIINLSNDVASESVIRPCIKKR